MDGDYALGFCKNQIKTSANEVKNLIKSCNTPEHSVYSYNIRSENPWTLWRRVNGLRIENKSFCNKKVGISENSPSKRKCEILHNQAEFSGITGSPRENNI